MTIGMRAYRKIIKPVSIFLTFSMVWLSVLSGHASAAMIGTEIVVDSFQGQEARNYIHTVFAREQVQNVLTAQGIDPVEATKRIDSLTDAEAIRLAKEIKQLPAGGSSFGIVIGAALIVFLVLLFTDIMGYTDVFPFVKHHQKK